MCLNRPARVSFHLRRPIKIQPINGNKESVCWLSLAGPSLCSFFSPGHETTVSSDRARESRAGRQRPRKSRLRSLSLSCPCLFLSSCHDLAVRKEKGKGEVMTRRAQLVETFLSDSCPVLLSIGSSRLNLFSLFICRRNFSFNIAGR